MSKEYKFHDFLLVRRENMNMTQRDLSLELGYYRDFIPRLENGSRGITVDKAEILAKKLGGRLVVVMDE